MNVQKIIATLIKEAIEVINIKYSNLAYHNISHTLRVIEATTNISAIALVNNKLSEREALLLPLAAAFHDIEQDESPKINEQKSAQIAADYMSKYQEFTVNDVKVIQESIMATVVLDYQTLKQNVNKNRYNTLILADADLADFGRPYDEYKYSYSQYFKEIYPNKTKDSTEYINFLKQQETLLKNKSYYTEEAKAIFNHQKDNLLHIKHLINEYEVK